MEKLAEQSVLGAILLDNKLIEIVKCELLPYDFFLNANKKVYSAMLENLHKNIGNDIVTLQSLLKNEVTVDYLIELANVVPSIHRLDEHIKIVKEHSVKEQLRIKIPDILKSKEDSNYIMSEIKNVIDYTLDKNNRETIDLQEYVDEYKDYIESEKKQEDIIPTRFRNIDNTITIKGGKLIIIGARPAIGKSALVLNLAKHFAESSNKILYISLEMRKKELMERLLSNITGIDTTRLERRDKLNADEWLRLDSAFKEIKGYNINIYDKGSLTIEMLQGLCRKLKINNRIDILIVDYIGLLGTSRYKGQRTNEVSFISRTLKQIAMDLDIPVIALSQLNRKTVGNDGKMREPGLADLRDSGSIEQDANIVMLMHKSNDEGYENQVLKLIIAKNRNGKIGEFYLSFRGDVCKIREGYWDNNNKFIMTKLKENVDIE